MTRQEEIRIKETRIRELLQKTGLKGILLKTQNNFSWFTAGGLNVVTIADVLGVTSILITETERYLIANRIETPRMLEDEGLKDFDFTLVQYEWYEGSEHEQIANILDPTEIGCDMPGFGYKCIAKEIQELRYALLEPEIERYLWLGEKASTAIEHVIKNVKPGMKESEVTGELSRVLWNDRIDSMCYQAAADERAYKYRHPIPTERTIDKYLMLNVNARKWGLVTTVTRFVHFGKLDPQLQKQFEDTVYIECAMIEATKPGTPVKDIFHKTCDLYKERGYEGEWKLHHQGGAQGYKNRDYIIRPDSEDIVYENQCFCWNPSIAGAKSEDAFIAKADGPLMITKPVIFPTIRLTVGQVEFTRPGILVIGG